jgi:hypothetical protein
VTIVGGKSGSGKTTFALRYLVNADLACRFAWDPDGQIASRLGIPNAYTVEDLQDAEPDGFVCFDPNQLFPGRHVEAFAWFCAWAYSRAAVIQGRKLVLVDEAWRYCSPNSIPQSLAECVQTGRVRGLDMMFATQQPQRLNGSITNEVTEAVSFLLLSKPCRDRMVEMGHDAAEVGSLPLGSFVSLNTSTGGILRGKVF